MSLAESAALLFIMGQHATEEKDREQPTFTTEVTMVPKAKRASKNQEVQATLVNLPIQSAVRAEGMVTSVQPVKESIGPQGFLTLLRKAKSRDEAIFAIASYTGYNTAENFGTQELQARMKATSELRPTPISGPSRRETQSAYRSMMGFVAGIPDMKQKQLNDLLGREKVSADLIIQHEKDSQDLSRSVEDRTLSQGLAAFERDRLSNIRKDLKALGF